MTGAILGAEQIVLQKAHRNILICYAPLVLVIIALGSVFAFIQGENDMYGTLSTTAEHWEACIIQPSYLYIPIAENIALSSQPFSECLAEQLLGPFCLGGGGNATTCAVNTLGCVDLKPEPNPDPALPVGMFAQALTAIGLQVIVFSVIGHAVLDRALRHPSWLPSSIAFIIWTTFAMLTFYTVNPIMPVSNQTNSTLMLIMNYMKKSKFDDMNNGDNKCDTAFNLIWGYLAVMLVVVLQSLMICVISFRAEYVRLTNPRRKKPEGLDNTWSVCVLCGLSMVFYLCIASGKIMANFTVTDAIESSNFTAEDAAADGLPFWYGTWFYPFQSASLDFPTLLFICSFMSIIRGHSQQSKSAFRLSAVTAFFFALTGWPPIIGGWNFYFHNDFTNYDTCYNYFLQGGGVSAYFGYPDEYQAKIYCNSFRLSLAGATGLWLTMHLIAFASFRTFHSNQHRESGIFDFNTSQHQLDIGLTKDGHLEDDQDDQMNPMIK